MRVTRGAPTAVSAAAASAARDGLGLVLVVGDSDTAEPPLACRPAGARNVGPRSEPRDL